MGTRAMAPVECEGLTIIQFARALGAGRSTVYALLGRGEVRAVKLGARRVIPRSEVGRLLAGGTNDHTGDDHEAA